jgi:cell wall-associated NlpC family hydrolase
MRCLGWSVTRTVVVVLAGLCALAVTAAPAGATALGWRVLHTGMSGGDVKRMQTLLTRLGFAAQADGEFGAATKRALMQFEGADHLTVDGVLSRADASVLRHAAGAAAPTAPAATTSPGATASVGADGLAVAPADAPDVVKAVIAAGNAIARTPYRYGGGHASFRDSSYDCSGSVSYALHGAALLNAPLDSGSLMSWGSAGAGHWITIYANSGHVYMIVAGLRFDTSGLSSSGSRWQSEPRSGTGFAVRHPTGL